MHATSSVTKFPVYSTNRFSSRNPSRQIWRHTYTFSTLYLCLKTTEKFELSLRIVRTTSWSMSVFSLILLQCRGLCIPCPFGDSFDHSKRLFIHSLWIFKRCNKVTILQGEKSGIFDCPDCHWLFTLFYIEKSSTQVFLTNINFLF
jgi:hypothetical protein